MDDLQKRLSAIGLAIDPKYINGGPPGLGFMQHVKSLVDKLAKFNKTFEKFHEGTYKNSENFVADISSLLRELECPYDNLYSGPYEERLLSENDKINLLDFLSSEIQTEMINGSVGSQSENGVLDLAGKEGYQQLKQLIQLLKMQKPPKTITSAQLFTGIGKKLDLLVKNQSPSEIIGEPMITGRLTPMHFIKLQSLNTILMKEYSNRREMLLTRLRVTLQSFVWAGRGEAKKDKVLALSNELLSKLGTKPSVSIPQMLSTRETILVTKKTSSGDTRIEASVNKHKMGGRVADRGGRVTEMKAMANETFSQQEANRNMPKWSSRQAPPPNQAGRGRGGGGGRGRGRGNPHKSPGRNGGGHDPRPQYTSEDGSGGQSYGGREFYNSGRGGGGRGGHRGGFRRGSFAS